MYFLSGCILKTCEKLDLLAITLKLEYIFFFDKTIDPMKKVFEYSLVS